jgi:hypothetical protein
LVVIAKDVYLSAFAAGFIPKLVKRIADNSGGEMGAAGARSVDSLVEVEIVFESTVAMVEDVNTDDEEESMDVAETGKVFDTTSVLLVNDNCINWGEDWLICSSIRFMIFVIPIFSVVGRCALNPHGGNGKV